MLQTIVGFIAIPLTLFLLVWGIIHPVTDEQIAHSGHYPFLWEETSGQAMILLAVFWLAGRWDRWRAYRNSRPLIEAEAHRDIEIRRRRSAKRWNERLKLLANACNTLGVSALLTLTLIPVANGNWTLAGTSAISGLLGFVFAQISAQFMLTMWKSEE